MIRAINTHEAHIAAYYLRRWYYEQLDELGSKWAEYYVSSTTPDHPPSFPYRRSLVGPYADGVHLPLGSRYQRRMIV